MFAALGRGGPSLHGLGKLPFLLGGRVLPWPSVLVLALPSGLAFILGLWVGVSKFGVNLPSRVRGWSSFGKPTPHQKESQTKSQPQDYERKHKEEANGRTTKGWEKKTPPTGRRSCEKMENKKKKKQIRKTDTFFSLTGFPRPSADFLFFFKNLKNPLLDFFCTS